MFSPQAPGNLDSSLCFNQPSVSHNVFCLAEQKGDLDGCPWLQGWVPTWKCRKSHFLQLPGASVSAAGLGVLVRSKRWAAPCYPDGLAQSSGQWYGHSLEWYQDLLGFQSWVTFPLFLPFRVKDHLPGIHVTCVPKWHKGTPISLFATEELSTQIGRYSRKNALI